MCQTKVCQLCEYVHTEEEGVDIHTMNFTSYVVLIFTFTLMSILLLVKSTGDLSNTFSSFKSLCTMSVDDRDRKYINN